MMEYKETFSPAFILLPRFLVVLLLVLAAIWHLSLVSKNPKLKCDFAILHVYTVYV